MKYRKKPVVIEAYLFDQSQAAEDFPDWLTNANGYRPVRVEECDLEGKTIMRIDTLESTMTAEPGDYIIKGIKG